MKCSECKIEYPASLVQPFVSSQGDANLCGICALAAKNKAHGTNFKRFAGEQAEAMRQAAIRFRAASKPEAAAKGEK